MKSMGEVLVNSRCIKLDAFLGEGGSRKENKALFFIRRACDVVVRYTHGCLVWCSLVRSGAQV